MLPTTEQIREYYNTSKLDFDKLLADASNIKSNLVAYINGFSENIRDIFDRYDFSLSR